MLDVRTFGSPGAPSVVLIHGQALDGCVFDDLALRLSREWRVLVPDLPGYGRSPPQRPWSFDRVRTLLEIELEQRGATAPALVAYSLGTYHALALTLARRIRVRKLYLLGASAGADQAALAPFHGLAAAIRAGTVRGEDLLAASAAPDWARTHPEEIEAARGAARRTPPESLAAELEAMVELKDLRPRLAEIAIPTRLRVGVLDRNTPLAWAEQIASSIPGAVLERVPGVGHLYFQEDREATLASVERFLAA